MSEMPTGWANTSLGEIITLRGEKLDPAMVPDAPFVGLEDIEPHTSRILKTGAASDVKSSVARFSAGDVLYSRLRPYLNKVAVPDFDGVASAEILVLQPTAATEAEFVRYRIMTREFLNFAALLDKGDRPRVNFKEIAEFRVALPPLPEQQRIVAKVDGVTARTARARKELDRIPTLISRYKSAVLTLAFSGKLTKDWRIERDGDALGVGEYPEGWTVRELAEISEIQGGLQVGKKRPPTAELLEVPYLRVANVQRGWLNLEEIKTLQVTAAERDRLLLADGDILMNEGGDRDKLGRGWVWRAQIPVCIHQNHVFRIRLNDPNFPPEYVSHYANENGQQYFIDQGTQTTNLASISKRKVAALPVPIPPTDEAAEIVRRIDSAFNWLDRVATDHAALARLLPKLDAAILTKAFRGELVAQNPNDESAARLLERVKAKRESKPTEKRSRKMRKTVSKELQTMAKNLEEVLAEAGDWISAQDAFQQCGVGGAATTEEIEKIYAELRKLDKAGRIEAKPIHDEQGRKLHDRLRLKAA